MKIGIGNDTKGLENKLHLVKVLQEKGFDVTDVGCHSLEPVDYADYAAIVGDSVVNGDFDLGILICGTGNGMVMAANKIKGVRATLCMDTFSAVMSREHNNSNVLCMGGWMIRPEKAAVVALQWLDMRFAGGIHAEKINKVMALENR